MDEIQEEEVVRHVVFVESNDDTFSYTPPPSVSTLSSVAEEVELEPPFFQCTPMLKCGILALLCLFAVIVIFACTQ